MEVIGMVIIIFLLVMAVFLLMIGLPIAIGKVLLGWSNKRIKYIFTNSMSSVFQSVTISLILTGLVLLVGIVFRQQWAFSGGLLLVYLLWTTTKTIIEYIKSSKNM